MDKELLRLLLQYSFYEENRAQIYRTIFTSEVAELYDIIVETHNKLKRDLSVTELKELYRANYPTATKAKLDNIFFIIDELPSEVKADVAKEVLKKAYITEAGRQISQIGIDIINGKSTSFSKAREILEKIEAGVLSDGDSLEQVSDELETILEAIETTTKWNFGLPSLASVAKGIGPGLFCIIAARPERGKSAMHISLAAAPGGFIHQGAVVHVFANEEPAQRLQGRAVMACTGMPLETLQANIEEAKRLYYPVKKNLKFFNTKGMDIDDLDAHLNKHRPDICVYDQLDKFGIKGTFARNDERLGALYISCREKSDRFQHGAFAISQINAEGEGKISLTSANLADARTSKAAEADLLIAISAPPTQVSANTRILNLIKNKITSNHNDIICVIQPEISRYVD